jgi:hypothetical protein
MSITPLINCIILLLLAISVSALPSYDPRSHMHVSIGGSGISFVRRPAVTDRGQRLPDDLAMYACSSLDGPDCAAVKAPLLKPDEKLIRLIAEALDIEELVESEAGNLEALDEALYRLFGLKSKDFLGDEELMKIDWESLLSEETDFGDEFDDVDELSGLQSSDFFEEEDVVIDLAVEHEEEGRYFSDTEEAKSFESKIYELYGHLFSEDGSLLNETRDKPEVEGETIISFDAHTIEEES